MFKSILSSRFPKQTAKQITQSLPALIVKSKQIANSIQQGAHKRRMKGKSDLFWEFQEYHQHEDAKRIDWKRSARSDQLYVKTHEWKTAQTVWFWCDPYPGMNWRSSKQYPDKKQIAFLTILVLALLLEKGYEQVGLIGKIPASFGQMGLKKFCDHLEHNAQTYQDLSLLTSRNQFCVLITDGYESLTKIKQSLDRFSKQKIKGILIQIYDPAEGEFPYQGRVEFISPVSHHSRFVIGRTETLKSEYQACFKTHQRRMKSLSEQAGFLFFSYRTDQDPVKALTPVFNTFNQSSGS